MNTFKPLSAARLALLLVASLLGLGLAWPLGGQAQDKTPDPAAHKHPDKTADADKDLSAQVRDLQAKLTKLEAALKQGAPSGMGGMSGMSGKGMGMMGMEGMDKMMSMMGGMPGMGGMQGKGMGGMAMEDDDMDMMKMMGMGGMKGMTRMQKAAALPGFPGASHIYHVGATGFFLDHADHVKPTAKQQAALAALKEKALLEKSTAQRKIDEAEQDLWTLTASDRPDAARIETKVHDIENLRGEQRLAFIRAVGEAAKLLTDEQRKAVLGTADKPAGHTGH
jgi:hypothetical protein